MTIRPEEWRPVPGWEGVYEASDAGNIRRIVDAFGTPILRPMKPIVHNGGYRYVRLRYKGRTSVLLVHAIVMLTFVGQRPDRLDINHKDGDRTNNALSNLEYVTRSENHIHAYRVLGRAKVRCAGEKNCKAKITGEGAEAIRTEYSKGEKSQREIGLMFGISQAQVSAIVRNAFWKRAS